MDVQLYDQCFGSGPAMEKNRIRGPGYRYTSQPAKRPSQDTSTATQDKGFSPNCTELYTFSHLFVLNVSIVGHPAEASLYAGCDKGT